MEFNDIIQVNATIIVGILILLTISSFADHSDRSDTSHIYFNFSIIAFGVSMVSAILSETLIVMGKLKQEKTIQSFKAFGLLILAFGVLYLVTSIVILVRG